MQWAVRRLDAGLDTAEHDPPPAAKALINAARGPAGAATVKGVTAAARITVQFGTEALKVRTGSTPRLACTNWQADTLLLVHAPPAPGTDIGAHRACAMSLKMKEGSGVGAACAGCGASWQVGSTTKLQGSFWGLQPECSEREAAQGIKKR